MSFQFRSAFVASVACGFAVMAIQPGVAQSARERIRTVGYRAWPITAVLLPGDDVVVLERNEDVVELSGQPTPAWAAAFNMMVADMAITVAVDGATARLTEGSSWIETVIDARTTAVIVSKDGAMSPPLDQPFELHWTNGGTMKFGKTTVRAGWPVVVSKGE